MGRQWGADVAAAPALFPKGAGLRPLTPGGPAFVLVDGASHRSLGGVLAWALRHRAGQVHLLVDASDEVAAVLARRAQPFTLPVAVWRVDPPTLRAVLPAGFLPSPALPGEAASFADVLRGAGVEPVVEFGLLTGEVLGLEVARVVVDRDGARLEVGVGSQDRQAHRDLEPNRPAEEQLAEVVAMIRRFRTPGGSAHLANSLGRERWLRRVVVARPELVGAAWLAPMPAAVPRGDLRTPTAAMAAGVDAAGRPVVVATSTGIDLDLVPAAADARRASGLADARLILAMPPADDHPRTRQLAALLQEPAQVVAVPAGWKDLTGTL
ncbi:MAG: hypothetical protein M3083_07340 [Actinomycetota bacterium]|nr:hypothetical protein [Actinomycetota bacterium]